MLQTPHPAIELIFLISLVIINLMPLMAWSLLRSERDRPSRLWFLGTAFYAGNGWLFTLQFVLPTWLSFGVGNSMTVIMQFLMMEALLQEFSQSKRRQAYMAGAVVVFTVVYIQLIELGFRTTYAALWMAPILALQQAFLVALCVRIRHTFQSKSSLILLLAFSLALVMNVIRIISLVSMGEQIPLLAFNHLSNFFIISLLVASICYSFGYSGFVLEKVKVKQIEQEVKATYAEDRRRTFEKSNIELQDMIKQRDHMVLMASRFSAVNSLAIFNTAIVHELSQPLQALLLSLEETQNQNLKLDPANSKGDVTVSIRLANQMGNILKSLRTLVSTQRADTERVDTDELLTNILPILKAQSLRMGVNWQLNALSASVQIMANKVLLERIIINLVANAIDALNENSSPSLNPRIELQTRVEESHGCATWVLTIIDNGPGIPAEMMDLVSRPFESTKTSGLGMGLALAQLILRMWQGRLILDNLKSNEGSGAVVSIEIPLAPSAITLTPINNLVPFQAHPL
jgi:C4-dicarboxylate-specific signal transduction histidine kinase